MSALLLRHVALPCLFLTSALLGGLRFEAETLALRFVAPPLATLLLATFIGEGVREAFDPRGANQLR